MRLLSAILGLALLSSGLRAEDAKPMGKYEKKSEPFTVGFDFKKDGTCTFTMKNGVDGCTAQTKYTVEKGAIKFEIASFETQGNFPVTKEKGYKFTCEYELKDKKFTVKKFDAADVDDGARGLLEGEYGPPKGD